MTIYAGDNNDYVVSARVADGPDVNTGSGTGGSQDTYNQHAVDSPEAASTKSVFLDATQTNSASVWGLSQPGCGQCQLQQHHDATPMGGWLSIPPPRLLVV